MRADDMTAPKPAKRVNSCALVRSRWAGADVLTVGRVFYLRRVSYIFSMWNSTTNQGAVMDPTDCEGLEVGLVYGRDFPELFLADDPRIGLTLTTTRSPTKCASNSASASSTGAPSSLT